MKTFSLKPADVKRQWVVIDASENNLGRIATVAASRLIGKYQASYTPHVDCGDFVVIINSSKLKVSGNKLKSKKYYRHSQYPGSLKELSLEEMIEKDSNDVIKKAIYGMLPKNKLRAGRMNRLKVQTDSEHNYQAQQPKKVEVTNG